MDSQNDIKQIVHKIYAQIHCMSHQIKWKWKDIKSTQLIAHNNKQMIHKLKYQIWMVLNVGNYRNYLWIWMKKRNNLCPVLLMIIKNEVINIYQ